MKSTNPHPPISFWAIWMAIPIGLYIMSRFVGPGPQPDEVAVVKDISIFGIIGIAMIVPAQIIRWFAIPKINKPEPGIVAMVIGLALSEAPGIMAIFVVPSENANERVLLYALAIGSCLTFAPFYAKRMCAQTEP